jgi:hypothetical protein
VSADPQQQNLSIVKFAHVGGEISDAYNSRSDLAKYDLSLSLADNWFVDYHGGISTVPGLELVDNLMLDVDEIKLYKFRFASNVGNTYIIILGRNYVRFVQDGAYVLETPRNVTNINVGGSLTIYSTAHGYAIGDWVKFTLAGNYVDMVGGTYVVDSVTANSFTIRDVYGVLVDTTLFGAYVGVAMCARIYTLPHAFNTADFAELKDHQIRDVVTFTHNNYPIYKLVRINATNWTLTALNLLNAVTRPTGIVATANTAGTDQCVYAVTAVSLSNVESLPSYYAFCVGNMDTTTIKSNRLTWTPVAGTQHYKVYRSRIVGSAAGTATASMQLGYIGLAVGATFTDALITPDFSLSMPNDTAPFTDGTVLNIICTVPGVGYLNTSVVSISDPNPAATGFIGQVILSANLTTIAGILIISGGKNYTTPTISVADGAGAVFTVEVKPNSGNNPACSSVFQQRRVYAATVNAPLTVTGSQPGQLDNFSTSDITIASDSYSHEVDSEDFSPIQHLVTLRGGMLIINAATVWLMTGENGVITATNVQVDFQNATGATQLVPLKISSDVLYSENAGGKIMQLAYNQYTRLYEGSDLTLLASHLFSKKNQIMSWGYAAEPYKMVWGRRSDGMMLNLTIIKEQEVYAWSRRTTRGAFLDVITLNEGKRTAVYCVVERYINGRYTKFLERVASREFSHVEDSFHMDCGLRAPINNPNASIRLTGASGVITVTASASVFAVTDINKIFRAGGGKGTVTTYVSPTVITVTMDTDRPVTELTPFTNPPIPVKFTAGNWSIDSLITTVVGLSHLENEQVIILADGIVVRGKSVLHGRVTLDTPASRVNVGLSYRCVAKNLPITTQSGVIENKRQRVVAMQMRVKDTAGLKIGTDINHLYDVDTKDIEHYDSASLLNNGLQYMYMEPIWTDDVRFYLVQDDPLPATVLGHVMEVDVGDTQN